jgi:large repetitive protein
VSSGFDRVRASGSVRRPWLLVALLAVLAAGGVAVWVAVAAGAPPPAPTISASPGNPTNQTAASFSYADAQSVTNFQCSLDGAAFVNCGAGTSGSTSYSSLANGSHTFRVQAFQKQGNLTSGQTSYTWTVDTVVPTVSSIGRAAGNPTNASSVSWTVTFSEAVIGVNSPASNFAVVAGGGLGGSPAVTGVTGSGTTYTVSASAGSGSGTLQLNLSSNLSQIKDLAGNGLAASFSGTASVYTLDRTPPPTPTIVSGPSGTVNQASASFGFADSEAGVSYLCKLDAGVFAACSNPASFSGLADGGHTLSVEAKDAAGNVSSAFDTRSWTVDTTPPAPPLLTVKPDNPNGDGIANFNWNETDATAVSFKCSIENGPFTTCPTDPNYPGVMAHYIVDVSNDGTHQFAVRAYDAVGNYSTTSYSWKVLHAINVTVDGNADGLLYPNGPTRTLVLVLHNPNNFPVTINLITVTVSGSPAGCAAGAVGSNPANLVLTQSNVDGSGAQTVTVPANTNLTLPPANRPTIRLIDTGLDQQACKNGSFTFSYLAKGSK